MTAEYVRATIPPLHLASFQQDDWISSVDVLSTTSPVAQWAGKTYSPSPGHERILSASYDGLLRVYNLSTDAPMTTSQTQNGDLPSPLKAARFITPSQIASSGLDRTVRLWKYIEEENNPSSATLTPSLIFYGHKASVDYLAPHAPSARLLSASADHTIGVWSTKKSDSPPAPSSLLPTARVLTQNKRRKLNPGPSGPSTIPTRGPLAILKAHSAPASAAIFAPQDPTVAYSTSWDHTLRTWDLPSGTAVDTRTTAHALLSLTALSSVNLLAAGSAARHIALIDPRVSATTVAAMTLRGHTNAVVDLATDPDSSYGLVSASHDGTCRIWDVRAGRSENEGRVGSSVFVIERESEKDQDGVNGAARTRKSGGEGRKVFAVRWDRKVGIVSAGEDRRVQINRGKAITAENRSSDGGDIERSSSGSGDAG